MSVAFNVAQGIGNKLAQGYQKVQDENAIESILAKAIESGDPAQLQNSIGQILSKVSPERQPMAIKYLESAYKNVTDRNTKASQATALRQAGVNPNLPANIQKAQYDANAKRQRLPGFMQPTGQGGQEPESPEVPTGNPAFDLGEGGNAQGQEAPNVQQTPTQSPTSIPSNRPKLLSKEEALQLSGHPDPEIRNYGDAMLKEISDQEKIQQKRDSASRAEKIEFHKESSKFDDELLKNSRIAKDQQETVKTIEKAVKSGNIRPTSFANIFKGMGKVGDKLAEAFLNEDEAALLASIPNLLEGWKQVFGVRLTDADLRLLQDKLPSIGKTEEANLVITRILKKYSDMTLLRSKISKDIKKENDGLRPLGYADMIEERFDNLVSPVKIVNPSNGAITEIPAYKLSEALESGAKIAPEGS